MLNIYFDSESELCFVYQKSLNILKLTTTYKEYMEATTNVLLAISRNQPCLLTNDHTHREFIDTNIYK